MLGNFIPGGRLQVYIYYAAFIRSSIKKFNFIKENKDNLLTPLLQPLP